MTSIKIKDLITNKSYKVSWEVVTIFLKTIMAMILLSAGASMTICYSIQAIQNQNQRSIEASAFLFFNESFQFLESKSRISVIGSTSPLGKIKVCGSVGFVINYFETIKGTPSFTKVSFCTICKVSNIKKIFIIKVKQPENNSRYNPFGPIYSP